MSIVTLIRLGELISQERATLLNAWRQKVKQLPAAAGLNTPALNDHIPDLLDELAEALQSCSDESISETMLEGTSPEHGRQRLEDGFDIAEVVAEYNILRDCIFTLAEDHGVVIRGTTLYTMNRVLDEAIGLAVQTFATQRALEVKQRRDEHLAFVAHDLRTPLSAIALSAHLLEIILGQEAQEEQTAQVLGTMHRNIKQLESLIAAVLNENVEVPTPGAGRLRRRQIDLWPLVEGVMQSFQLVAETGGTQLVNEVATGLMIEADAGMLSRIFQNLISNAIKYAPRGTVSAGASKGTPGGDVECWVTDNGPGIPSDLAAKIFDKYEKDPEGGDGIGLGLAIVKEFVEAHGGTVRVESVAGQGSTFRFTIPPQ
jgi:two-component system, OmpR family, phosphate regulon sensor histidine kinase PhoR